MSRYALPVAVLTGVYLLVLASLDPLDALLGAVVAAALVAALRPYAFEPPPRPLGELPRRLLAAIPLALVTIRDITVGTWDVALVVLHLRPLSSPGTVAIPIGERTETGIAATALLVTLAPGEFLVDVDRDRGVMLFHVLDASDPDAVRARMADFYERHQRKVFP
ncbi:MAG TPA: Na+/H+ antiporter subunit E [Gaiellaceae bacterium]|nr:Na+/H+ antiporter subunit E [Gaiellaceae bacterium]